jgi:site-specific recombinase XerD
VPQLKPLPIVQRRLLVVRPAIFTNEDGNPWTVDAVNCRFGRLKKRLGVRYASYSIRHGFCQRMLESGADHLAVAELMGHVNGQMVATTYSHMNRADAHLDEALRKGSGKP